VILDYETEVITRVEFESKLGTVEPKAKCNSSIDMIYRVEYNTITSLRLTDNDIF
jgi:hypothetical protein